MNENKAKKSGLSFSSGIGSSSILVIFVILCLVSFATLSIVSANADYKLSKKVLDRTTAYYEAEGQAHRHLPPLTRSFLPFTRAVPPKLPIFRLPDKRKPSPFPYPTSRPWKWLSTFSTLKKQEIPFTVSPRGRP